MEISVTEAKAQLTDLVRRAEAGEDVVLTRHGREVARIEASGPVRMPMRAIRPSAARSADFLYEDVPMEVREALSIGPRDAFAYDIDMGKVSVRKIAAADQAHLRALQSTLVEWDSPGDAAAFDDL